MFTLESYLYRDNEQDIDNQVLFKKSLSRQIFKEGFGLDL